MFTRCGESLFVRIKVHGVTSRPAASLGAAKDSQCRNFYRGAIGQSTEPENPNVDPDIPGRTECKSSVSLRCAIIVDFL